MDLGKFLSLNLRLVKLRRFLGSLIYPIQRDRLARHHNSKISEPLITPGKILQVEQTSRGGKFSFEHAELEICFLTPDLVQIDWKPGVPPIPYGIVQQDWSEVETTFSKESDRSVVSSSALKVIVTANGSLEFQNTNGQTIRQELPPLHRSEEWIHQAQLRSKECIYGLGERATSLDLRKPKSKKQQIAAYRMWNSDRPGIYGSGVDPLYLCIPTYLSLDKSGSYLVFYENSYPATFSFTDVENSYPATFNFKDVATAAFEGGALRYYFTFGSPAEVLERYTQLTGRPLLPPRWALGYHQSRWGYETEEEVRKTVQGFETHNLPLSAIHLDIDCQKEFRAFTIDPDRFPKLGEFSQELAAKGVHLIAINSPGVKADPSSKLFLEGKAQEVFCRRADGKIVTAPVWSGWCAFPDFTNPLARHWWSRQYEYLLDLGISGFWHDMNEPAVLVLWGDRTLPAFTTLHHMESRGGDHREAHNVYGLLQARAGYEALCEYQPQHRPFIVARAGWAGLQRYAWTWTGDIETSWQGLRQTIPTILGMGLSGIPYSGSDIGGFKGNPSPELYIRWFQMSCFCPFFRTHCADNAKPRTPWSFGEPYLSIAREFLQLRYRLLPYFYTLAWEATQTGHPLMRPLFWYDYDDERLWDIDDAFFLGDALLVCPVVESGVRSRNVILPKGHWYNFWDDTLLEGENQITLDAPLEKIPLLVKAGKILSMEQEQKLVLHIYAPVTEDKGQEVQAKIQNSYTLYSDAGDGYGAWRLDKFRIVRNDNSLELSWEQQGNFAFPYQSVQIHLHGFQPSQAYIDGKEIALEDKYLECNPFEQVYFQGR
ncbi:glycoside hydrolase family 31 protein [Gloeocapsopsis crepidinum LEGE 06123]|uniref:Glycoside hydrolase family 31 protein n=1 Tax=Gloeocapsopsis crepidinum LEGE 06123 TaxID=588587 RepID=A0ABR9UY06_9CHRO|nr:glycoside hydrolase family 31 protein [Gloeocapsopsis crepidinum]MBE9193184.1 glycoside hydrolase family 31 protein [Gloeocapsopsis crepidinum LEGE 06123]